MLHDCELTQLAVDVRTPSSLGGLSEVLGRPLVNGCPIASYMEAVRRDEYPAFAGLPLGIRTVLGVKGCRVTGSFGTGTRKVGGR